MATTTNFGWTTPDNTGYVKDGALAIRTLGSAIDTSMLDLKGGTTDQVLKKASNTDMDFVWQTVATTPRIAQVVAASTTNTTLTTSTTFADVNSMTVTITPTLATSKILILVDCNYECTSGTSGISAGVLYKVLRGSTSITTGNSLWIGLGSAPVNFQFNASTHVNYVDSPATTSATTYKLQFAKSVGGQVQANSGTRGNITALEILV